MNKRKVKLFFVFLLCSFFAWFVSNLSESFISNATFDLNFINIPADKQLISASKEKLDVKLEAVGFQFLRFNFNNKNVDVDLSNVQEEGGKNFIISSSYQKQIEKQLSKSMKLLQIVGDTIFFDFQVVNTKKILVKPLVDLNFKQNYLLEGNVVVNPAEIRITGPANEIDRVLDLKIPKIELNDLASDFSKTVYLIKPDSIPNTSFSAEKVTVSGKVSRFSEKIIEVPVQVLNLPENMSIRMFPDKVNVLCKAKMSDLKSLTSSDFSLIADYKEVVEENRKSNTLSLSLQMVPKNVFRTSLDKKKVEYILRNK